MKRPAPNGIQPLLVGGESVVPLRGGTFTVRNPVDGSVVAEVAKASASELRTAIGSAQEGMPYWRNMAPVKRYDILQRGVQNMRDEFDRLARTVVLETGKPVAEAEAEVFNSIRFFDFFSQEALRLPGEFWGGFQDSRDAYVIYEPVGIVGAITPWNFPAFMVACKLGASLAAGCATLLKPAEETPLTAIKIAECFVEAGLPPGVLSVLPTDTPEEIGSGFLSNKSVSCVTFTGSTAVGMRLLEGAAATIKKVLLELGGNAPVIITEDADLEKAANQVVRARFSNAGQACVAANRVYVDQRIADVFLDQVVDLTDALQMGDPFDLATNIGPLINQESVTVLQDQVARARAAGAEVLVGGSTDRNTPTSAYFQPSVMVAEASNPVFREEIFGPVLSVTLTKSDSEAIAYANDSDYGLSAYVFSGEEGRGRYIARQLNTGNVGVNCALVSEPMLPFGGVGLSGLGRERGRAGVMEFTESKTIQVNNLN